MEDGSSASAGPSVCFNNSDSVSSATGGGSVNGA